MPQLAVQQPSKCDPYYRYPDGLYLFLNFSLSFPYPASITYIGTTETPRDTPSMTQQKAQDDRPARTGPRRTAPHHTPTHKPHSHAPLHPNNPAEFETHTS